MISFDRVFVFTIINSICMVAATQEDAFLCLRNLHSDRGKHWEESLNLRIIHDFVEVLAVLNGHTQHQLRRRLRAKIALFHF